MKKIFLVFPHQLFKDISLLQQTDEIYLEYKQAINNISKEMPKLIDRRMFEQKTMEFHSKKNAVVKRILEMPK